LILSCGLLFLGHPVDMSQLKSPGHIGMNTVLLLYISVLCLSSVLLIVCICLRSFVGE